MLQYGIKRRVILSTDAFQYTRIIYSTVDMGSYEFCKTTGSSSPVVCATHKVPSSHETYTVSGVYSDTLSNYLGCDSVITINLTVNNSFGSQTITACNSFNSPRNSYVWTTSGVYNDTVPNAAGCDSIITTTLMINNSKTGIDNQVLCNTYTWIDGNTYTSSDNSITHTLVEAAATGCDSIVTLNLTINNSATRTDIQTHCNT